MSRKLALPVLLPRPAPPTVDVIRKRLGGRSSTEAGAGDAIAFVTDGGVRHTGVILFVRGDELDVWVAENVVRRARRAAASPVDTPLPRELSAVAADARVFGGLAEGERVRYLHDGRIEEGLLVEKCRFGALIERDDGAILGVGFRRLFRTEAEPDPSLS